MVIPEALRHRLGVGEGDIPRAEIDERERLVLEPVAADPVERLRRAGAAVYEGIVGHAEQRRLRREWE
ncbi:MAG: hypothetical protein ACR2G7_09765 [Acidimicrobiales bacterium]